MENLIGNVRELSHLRSLFPPSIHRKFIFSFQGNPFCCLSVCGVENFSCVCFKREFYSRDIVVAQIFTCHALIPHPRKLCPYDSTRKMVPGDNKIVAIFSLNLNKLLDIKNIPLYWNSLFSCNLISLCFNKSILCMKKNRTLFNGCKYFWDSVKNLDSVCYIR